PPVFEFQASKPAALPSSLLQLGVFVLNLTMGWFGGPITRQFEKRIRLPFSTTLCLNQSTRGTKLPLDKYSADFRMRWASKSRVKGVSGAGKTITPNVTLVDL
ncbi:unnamed protein product, partial [Ectocarpus fasciculatus]